MSSRDSIRHRYIPQPLSLMTFVHATGGPYATTFRVPIPDSRLRVKLSVLFIPGAGGAPNAAAAGASTLWLYEADADLSGLSGITIPATDIVGTSAAPLVIPASADLGGYSREFVTAADAIEGVLTSTPGGPMIGTWMLQTRYQPDAVRFTFEEWDQIKAGCNPQLKTPTVLVP